MITIFDINIFEKNNIFLTFSFSFSFNEIPDCFSFIVRSRYFVIMSCLDSVLV